MTAATSASARSSWRASNARAPRPRRRAGCTPTCSTGVAGRVRRGRSPTRPTSPRASAPALAPEILRHEPPEALFAGADGLDAIRALLEPAGRARARAAASRSRSAPGRRPRSRELLRARGLRRPCAASATWPGSSACVVGGGRDAMSAVADAARTRCACEACVATAGSRCSRPTPSTGSAATPTTSAAARRLYELKGRPPARPAAVMFFALARARCEALAELAERRARRSRRCCPGRVTLLLANRAQRFRCRLPAATPATLGLRVPRCPRRWPRCRRCRRAGDAVERQPLRRARRAAPRRRCPGACCDGRRSRARRRRAAGHALDRGRPARLRASERRWQRAARGRPARATSVR